MTGLIQIFNYDKTKKIGKAPPSALQHAARIVKRIRKQPKVAYKVQNQNRRCKSVVQVFCSKIEHMFSQLVFSEI
ncbi:MAG: hypothetical protein ACJ0DI_07600 [bacterium]